MTQEITNERMQQIADRLNRDGENFDMFAEYDEDLTYFGDAAEMGTVMVLNTGQYIMYDGTLWVPGWDSVLECQCMLCGEATPVTEMEEHMDTHMCSECAEAEGWHK